MKIEQRNGGKYAEETKEGMKAQVPNYVKMTTGDRTSLRH